MRRSSISFGYLIVSPPKLSALAIDLIDYGRIEASIVLGSREDGWRSRKALGCGTVFARFLGIAHEKSQAEPYCHGEREEFSPAIPCQGPRE